MTGILPEHDRRKFLKLSAAGAAATGFAAGKAIARSAAPAQEPGWFEGMEINPQIPNTRVVAVHDEEMAPERPLAWEWLEQNANVNPDQVALNMDKMAIALADLPVTNPADFQENAKVAWAAIFRKPTGKTWNEVKVAIKIVAVGAKCCPRLAVIKKLCQVLGELGVQMGNITMFDCPSRNMVPGHNLEDWYNQPPTFEMLPEGVVIDNTLGGEPINIILPQGEPAPCAKELADGTTDILINLAVNKGHGVMEYGGFTACLKNHIGTLVFNHPGQNLDVWPETLPAEQRMPLLCDMNKSSALMGGNPTRQQLCFVDSLWGSNNENVPKGDDIVDLHRLLMGTHPGMVDYLLVKDIRSDGNIMPDARERNWEAIDLFLTEFGYDPDSLQDLHLEDALAYEPQIVGVDGGKAPRPSGEAFRVTLNGTGRTRPASVSFTIPKREDRPRIRILNMRGKLVRSFSLSGEIAHHSPVTWDGRDGSGRRVPAGAYAVALYTGNRRIEGKLITLYN